ncbi:hypothetical protein MASR2M66_19260 [Chloroflexota bacterium]
MPNVLEWEIYKIPDGSKASTETPVSSALGLVTVILKTTFEPILGVGLFTEFVIDKTVEPIFIASELSEVLGSEIGVPLDISDWVIVAETVSGPAPVMVAVIVRFSSDPEEIDGISQIPVALLYEPILAEAEINPRLASRVFCV